MSQTFQYDALEVLNRAQRSADEWWSNTLNNAKKRTDLDQTHLDNAFKNDERAVTYAPKIWATNAENIYKGTKAQYDTMLEPDRYDKQHEVYGRDASSARMERDNYDWSQSPENSAARKGLIDDKWQSPYARLTGAAAAADIADREEANRVAYGVAQQYPGALSAQATFGRQTTDTGSFNIGADIAIGNFEGANKQLEQAGLGMAILPGKVPGTVVIRHGDGTTTVEMDQDAAARYVQDRTGQKPGQAQTAFATERKLALDQRRAAQKLEDDRLDDERRQLMTQYQAVVKESGASSPAAVAIADRLDQITRYRNQPRPAPTVSLDALITGKAQTAPQQPQAGQQATQSGQGQPIQQTSQAPAPVQSGPYVPPQAQQTAPAYQPKSYERGESNGDLVGKLRSELDAADSALNRVRSDWATASSLANRGSFTDQQRQAIKAALDKAEAEYARRKADYWSARRAFDKDRGESAYSPGNAMQQAQQANARRIAQTYAPQE